MVVSALETVPEETSRGQRPRSLLWRRPCPSSPSQDESPRRRRAVERSADSGSQLSPVLLSPPPEYLPSLFSSGCRQMRPERHRLPVCEVTHCQTRQGARHPRAARLDPSQDRSIADPLPSPWDTVPEASPSCPSSWLSSQPGTPPLCKVQQCLPLGRGHPGLVPDLGSKPGGSFELGFYQNIYRVAA